MDLLLYFPHNSSKSNCIHRQISDKNHLVGEKAIFICNAGILSKEHSIAFFYTGFKTSSVGNSPFVPGN